MTLYLHIWLLIRLLDIGQFFFSGVEVDKHPRREQAWSVNYLLNGMKNKFYVLGATVECLVLMISPQLHPNISLYFWTL